MKILIVEDNLKMRDMVREVLTKNLDNLDEIAECSDGKDAVELYCKILPDWVLMDIQLESMDGLTATEKIMSTNPEAKIIIVTNFDYPEYREAASDAGACEFVLKENILDILGIIGLAT